MQGGQHPGLCPSHPPVLPPAHALALLLTGVMLKGW